MARKCTRCMRGTAQFMIENEDSTQEYICHRCYIEAPAIATPIKLQDAEDAQA